jgi:hypothetical protein
MMLSNTLNGKLVKRKHGNPGRRGRQGKQSGKDMSAVLISWCSLSLLSQIAITELRVDARKVHDDEKEEKDTSS